MVHAYDPSVVTAYDYVPIGRIVYGMNSIERLPDECDARGGRRVLVLTTPSLRDTDVLERTVNLLGDRCVGVSSGASQHVRVDSLGALIEEGRRAQPDVIVSLGGGSVIDSGKALVGALSAGAGDGRELLEYRTVFKYPAHISQKPYPGPFVPQIAISTTLSAAEYDGVFGFSHEGVKFLSIDNRLVPRVAILDPSVTTRTPEWLWTSTGIRAVDHCIETYLSRAPTPPTDAGSLHALGMLFANLPRSRGEPPDFRARLQCQLAGWLSMLGVANVLLGLSHGIGHQLGGRNNVPHGYTSCVILPIVMRYVLREKPDLRPRLAELAGAAGIDTHDMSVDEAAEAICAGVAGLIDQLGLPRRLRDVGVSESDFDPLAEASMGDLVVAFSPVTVSREDVVALLREAY